MALIQLKPNPQLCITLFKLVVAYHMSIVHRNKWAWVFEEIMAYGNLAMFYALQRDLLRLNNY